MKLFIILTVFLFSHSLFAYEAINSFTCAGSVNPHGDFKTEVQVEGMIVTKEYNKYEAIFNTSVEVDCNEHECWSVINDSYSVENYPNYRPRVYVGHAKFEHYLESNNGIHDHWASSYIVIPHSLLQETQSFGEGFQAAIVLSGIDDHHGASVTLNCSTDSYTAESIFNFKESVDETIALKVKVRSEELCGEFDPYFIGDACIYKVLVLDGPENLIGEIIHINVGDDMANLVQGQVLSVEMYNADPYYEESGSPLYYAVPYVLINSVD